MNQEAGAGSRRQKAEGRQCRRQRTAEIRSRLGTCGRLRSQMQSLETVKNLQMRASLRGKSRLCLPACCGFCLLLLLLPSAYWLTAHWPLATASAQVPQGNSPLYSSRPYEARAPSGLPKALNGVGIDQKLNRTASARSRFEMRRAKA